jgi:glycosyltransferase involved in cell wall biosynthesis
MSATAVSKRLLPDPDAPVAAAQFGSTLRELRVLQVFSVLSVGGAETWLMSLLKYFNEFADTLPVKVKCDILLTGGEPSVFDEEAKALGARLFYVPFTRQSPIRFMREFRRILRAGQYDVIHDHQDYVAGLHFLMGLGSLPPIRIAHVHSAYRHRSNYANDRVRAISMSLGRRMLRRLATNVLGTSQQAIDEYGFRSPEYRSVGVVNCGFDPRKFVGDYQNEHVGICRRFGWDKAARIILFVGRLDGDALVNGRAVSQKNVEFALEIAKECFARDERVRLLVAGSGDPEREKKFRARVNDWGIGERVRFLRESAEVPKLMIGSDLLLSTSPAEGLGMVVVEAQAAGLPVLASDATPRECVVVPELVEFLPLTDTESWARQTLQLLGRDRPTLSECNAAVRTSPFSIENSARSLAVLYGERGNA